MSRFKQFLCCSGNPPEEVTKEERKAQEKMSSQFDQFKRNVNKLEESLKPFSSIAASARRVERLEQGLKAEAQQSTDIKQRLLNDLADRFGWHLPPGEEFTISRGWDFILEQYESQVESTKKYKMNNDKLRSDHDNLKSSYKRQVDELTDKSQKLLDRSHELGRLKANSEKAANDWGKQREVLEIQLHSLQKQFSQAADRFQPLDEHVLEQQLKWTLSQVHSLSINLAKAPGLNTNALRVAEGFNIRSMLELSKSYLRGIVEHSIWKCLLEEIFPHPFSIFGENGDKVADAWTVLFLTGHPWPQPQEEAEEWRCKSFERLSSSQGGSQRAQVKFELTSRVEKRIRKFSPGNFPSEINPQIIDDICSQLLSIAFNLGNQRCRWIISFPEPNLQRGSTKSVSDFPVSPVLRRIGDLDGRNLHEEADLIAANYLTNEL